MFLNYCIRNNQSGCQGDQIIGGKFAQIFDKVAKTVAQLKKCQNLFFEAKFESTKHLHQTLLNS